MIPAPRFRRAMALALGLAFAHALHAQKTATWNPVHSTVIYQFRVMNPTPLAAAGIEIALPLPRESPRQTIHYLLLSLPGPSRSMVDEHGQRLERISIDRLEPGAWVEVAFVAGVTLRNLRWIDPGARAGPGGPSLSAQERARYLKALPYYSMESPLMRETAARLSERVTSDYEKVVKIHDFIVNTIRYVRDDVWDPAATVLARGTGSCSEFNYLLSGLCRLAGLPTRYVGGTSYGYRDFPATDTVFHRWTEVFLEGVGWFPVDCSRDSNRMRGDRANFGRVYADALEWCCQTGDEEDALGWEYRAAFRTARFDPLIGTDHRVRWFSFIPADEVERATEWFAGSSGGGGVTPAADALECALLRWQEAPLGRRIAMIDALAAAGRPYAIERAGMLPLEDDCRANALTKLFAHPADASAVLEKTKTIAQLRTWFKANETRLRPAGEGRFKLDAVRAPERPAGTPPGEGDRWIEVAGAAVKGLRAAMPAGEHPVACMPVVDHTPSGLGEVAGELGRALKEALARQAGVRLVDDAEFDRWLAEHGPGKGQFWLFAASEPLPAGRAIPPQLRPDFIVVPIVSAERPRGGGESPGLALELRALEVSSCRTLTATRSFTIGAARARTARR